MPPCIWIASPAAEARSVAGVGLGRGAGERRVRIARVDTPGGAVDGGAGRRGAQHHLRHAVLERLERAMARPNVLRRVRVLERDLEAAGHDPEHERRWRPTAPSEATR